MSASGIQAELLNLLRPGVEALGFELWGLEYNAGGKRPMLRIYIESDNGISVDDCAAVSRQVSGIMDVEDPIKSEYTLEVSSPGVDRPLFDLSQYQRYVGHKIKLKLRYPFEGQRNYTGVLAGIEEEDIVLQVDEHELILPVETVDKARIVGETQPRK